MSGWYPWGYHPDMRGFHQPVRRILLAGALATSTVLAACGGDEPSSTAGTAAATARGEVAVNPVEAVVIDVRTPAEFASGHLEGAVNIDVQAPDFADQVSRLDPAGRYLVYCRSGNRSAVAVAMMADLGFGDLTDLGGVAEAAQATGLAVV